MKGFGIYIKNELLDPKHFRSMGPAVWLYLWLIDKITSISEDEIGSVLGGKPVKYTKDVEPELGIPHTTYVEWVNRLKDSGYINTLRSPHGLIITVNKAKKIFGSKVGKATSLVGNPTSNIRQYNRHKEIYKEKDKKTETSENYLINIPLEDLVLLKQKFGVSQAFISAQAERALHWLRENGKKKRNYKSFLRNWMENAAKWDKEKNPKMSDGRMHGIEAKKKGISW